MEEPSLSEREIDEILKDDDDFTEIYCFCCTPAHDKMIACNGDHCEMEWFHVECVGLDYENLPLNWMCEDCCDTKKSGKI